MVQMILGKPKKSFKNKWKVKKSLISIQISTLFSPNNLPATKGDLYRCWKALKITCSHSCTVLFNKNTLGDDWLYIVHPHQTVKKYSPCSWNKMNRYLGNSLPEVNSFHGSKSSRSTQSTKSICMENSSPKIFNYVIAFN